MVKLVRTTEWWFRGNTLCWYGKSGRLYSAKILYHRGRYVIVGTEKFQIAVSLD